MFKSLDELREQIKAFGLGKHEEKIVALAKPAIRMLPSLVEEDEIPIGVSKLGGNPDLPADFEWKQYEGKPLTFIGQFKLSEIAPYDRNKELPAEGILYFFYERWGLHYEEEAWQVKYIEDDSIKLLRRPHPQLRINQYGKLGALPSHKLRFEAKLSLPTLIYNENQGLDLDLSEAEEEKYWELLDFEFSAPRHHFLGYADAIQHRVERLNSLLLFQIDTDNSLNVLWGDVGRVYITILKIDLEARKLDDVWFEMQF